MFKNFALTLSLLFSILQYSFAQEKEQSLLNTPENWQSELLHFPLGFAPSLPYTGVEDIRFSPGWSKVDSNEFWSYSFIWYVDQNTALTSTRLEEHLETYFDGLMRIEQKQKIDSLQADKTISVFLKTKGGFQGKISVYDAFFTKKMMQLYAKVEEDFCQKTKKQIIRFEFSTKNFEDSTWKIFDQLDLTIDCD